MKKTVLFIFLMVLASPALWAAGIGIYGTGGVGATTWNYRGGTYSSTDYFYGGGIVIDSVAAKDAVFGYRFTAGYEQYVFKDPNSGSTIPTHRFSMSHAFGLGLLRNEDVRFWIGPRFGFHYLYKKTPRYDLDYLGLDILLAMGLNVNMGAYTTLFFDIGFGYMGNYNLNLSENGHAIGVDGKVGIMFRVDDTFVAGGSKPIQIQ